MKGQIGLSITLLVMLIVSLAGMYSASVSIKRTSDQWRLMKIVTFGTNLAASEYIQDNLGVMDVSEYSTVSVREAKMFSDPTEITKDLEASELNLIMDTPPAKIFKAFQIITSHNWGQGENSMDSLSSQEIMDLLSIFSPAVSSIEDIQDALEHLKNWGTTIKNMIAYARAEQRTFTIPEINPQGYDLKFLLVETDDKSFSCLRELTKPAEARAFFGLFPMNTSKIPAHYALPILGNDGNYYILVGILIPNNKEPTEYKDMASEIITLLKKKGETS